MKLSETPDQDARRNTPCLQPASICPLLSNNRGYQHECRRPGAGYTPPSQTSVPVQKHDPAARFRTTCPDTVRATFLEGTGKLNKKAKFGLSKEKRYDCPLVTLGLVLDGDGFPKRSRVFEGNVSEGKTLEKMLLGLQKEPTLIKPLIIVDAGIAAEDNLRWLRDNHYDYLAVSRRRKREIPEELASRMVTVKEDKQSLVRAVLKSDEKTKQVEVWCHSIQKEKKEEGIKNLFRQRFEEGLKKIEAGLTKKNGI